MQAHPLLHLQPWLCQETSPSNWLQFFPNSTIFFKILLTSRPAFVSILYFSCTCAKRTSVVFVLKRWPVTNFLSTFCILFSNSSTVFSSLRLFFRIISSHINVSYFYLGKCVILGGKSAKNPGANVPFSTRANVLRASAHLLWLDTTKTSSATVLLFLLLPLPLLLLSCLHCNM